MKSRKAIVAASLAVALGAFAALPAAAQTDPHQHEQGTPPAGGAQGTGMGPGMMGGQGTGMGPGMMGGQGMGGMMRMMQGCPMMQAGGHGLPHLPPGNEKLELQMHADMMKAMGDILARYAARLPEKKK